MLINKSHLEAVGVPSKLASRYVLMLNRTMQSTMIKPTEKGQFRQGRQPTKYFNLNVAIGIATEYKNSQYPLVKTEDWEALYEALLKIPYE